MKGRCLLRGTNALVPALPTSMIMLAGCAIPMPLNFQNAASTEFLDGHYQRPASCSYQRPGPADEDRPSAARPYRYSMTAGSDKRWELAFINEDGGRQTRLEVTTLR
jgi:hypothetical protein